MGLSRQLLPPLPLARAVTCVLLVVSCIAASGSQAATVTDPVEAAAVNSIFRQWNISAATSRMAWNTTGDICDGTPVSDPRKFDDDDFNPNIMCSCDGNNPCHVIKLKAFNLNITGRIPDELKKLTYLENLLLSQNHLTGPLPAFIGNFTQLQYVTFGYNSLNGTIPKELGNLANLLSLALNSNNFSGPLPPEIGKLMSLEQLYIDSAGLSGEFPSTMANLHKLHTIIAGDNNFSGKLPDFIGNMPRLRTLKLHGNSFEGPIPPSFSNLTGLQELWLCDLLNGSSSLEFISNMTHLTKLILRNSKISDVTPSLAGLVNITHLDLSFNNLSGQLRQELFNLPRLESLYLGNNSLSGYLPPEKSSKLVNIDLSYNDFSGSLPSWANEQHLELNLVANNFIADRNLPWGLNCLQKSVPCFRGSPVYYSFAINCGGKKTTDIDGTVYEADDEVLSTASYYVKSSRRWAVSSVGEFVGDPNPNYIEFTTENFTNTSNPKLFQSMRLSPSSLRYYGLALENGNYSIALRFAETQFPDDLSWWSIGRRIFDIYIQGILVEKDFDIRKAAGGRSFTEVPKKYVAQVTNNFLEIHFFWAGKGTTQIPVEGYHGPSISAISITPNFRPTVANHLPTNLSRKTKALISSFASGTAVVLFIAIIFIWRRKRQTKLCEDEELRGLSVRPNTFSFGELKAATEDFSAANKLGEGGFGPVYKGKLTDGRTVAVKQLSVVSLQGKRQFVTEVATISSVQHKHLVKLYGCCHEGNNRLLVYEFLENNSLDHALFGKSGLYLDWPARYNICVGTARGLAYLHEGSRLRIVHRDIKASNILLDQDLTPKISDFGLAKLFDDKKTHISTRVAGTVGYLAPEYALRGHLTEKADVYGFGVLVLEILSGRPNTGSVSTFDGERIYLLDWAWLLHENNCDLDMLDKKISSFNKEEVVRMIQVAFLCTQTNPIQRPSMSRVVAMLVGEVETGDATTRPVYLTEWRYDECSSLLTGTTTTSVS